MPWNIAIAITLVSFLSNSYNYFRYTSANLEYPREGNFGQSWHIHQWKPYPQNTGIATEIASISVSDAKLLLLRVWGTVSTSCLYLMVFYIVWRCRRKCKGIGRARKLCRSRWDHVEMFSHRLVITTSGFSGFLLPVCISDVKNLTCAVVFVCFKHFHRKSVYLFKCKTITSIRW